MNTATKKPYVLQKDIQAECKEVNSKLGRYLYVPYYKNIKGRATYADRLFKYAIVEVNEGVTSIIYLRSKPLNIPAFVYDDPSLYIITIKQ